MNIDNWIPIQSDNQAPIDRLVRVKTINNMIKIAKRTSINGRNIWQEYRKDIQWTDKDLKEWSRI